MVTMILATAPSMPKMVIPSPKDTKSGTPAISKTPVKIRAERNFVSSGNATEKAKLLLLKTNSLLVIKANATAQIHERIFASVMLIEKDIPKSKTAAFSPKIAPKIMTKSE